MKTLIITAVYCFLSIPFTLFANETHVTNLQYEITSNSDVIGNLTLKISGGQDGYLIAQHTQINISTWWGKLDLSSNLVEKYKQGELVSSDSKIFDDDKAYWITMEQSEAGVWGSHTEVKNTTQKEIDKFAALTIEISNLLLPSVSEILSLSQAIFSDAKGEATGVRFARSEYDITANQLPVFIQTYHDKPLPSAINILDTEELKISKVRLTDFGNESLQLGSQSISARHIEISDANSESAHIWIGDQTSSIPYMVQFTGIDEDLPIKIKLITSPDN